MDIQLQDIIQIHWNNVSMDSPRYIVDYISSEKLRLINIDNLEEKIILLKDGVPETGENKIVQIDILNRSDKKGYAEQNNLEPGVWINISFNNEQPIKGKIFEKNLDMIVVKLVLNSESLFDKDKWIIPETEEEEEEEEPDDWGMSPEETVQLKKHTSMWDESPEKDDIIYIDFKYEGILDNLKIEIIDNPLLIKIEPTKIDVKVDESPIEFDINFNPTDEIIELYQEVEVPEDEKRYDLQVQLEDFLDDLLSDVPTDLRTRDKLNQINIIVERFKELRFIFSNIDDKGYIISLKVHEPGFNPITSILKNMNQSLFWLLPVVKNIKKLYDVDEEEVAEDVLLTNLRTYIDLENNYQDQYESPHTQNRYINLLRNQQILNKEYLLPSQYDASMQLTVNTNLPVVINNEVAGEDDKSTVFGSKLKSSTGSIIEINNATTVYSLPTTYLRNNDINIKLPRKRLFVSDKDSIILKDFIKLNKVAIVYSILFLPATSIYFKSVLNSTPRYLYRFLKSKISKKIIDLEELTEYPEEEEEEEEEEKEEEKEEEEEEEEEKEEEEESINKNIQYEPLSIPNLEAFIKIVVPTIKDKIAYINDMDPAPLSIYGAILALESFLVYVNNINQEMILKLQQKIDANIDNLKLSYLNNLTQLEQIYKYKASEPKNLLDKTVFKDIIDNVENIPDYKFIKNMLAIDGCTLYTLLLVQKNFALNIKKDVESFTEKDETPEDISQDDSPIDCKKYEIVKQYTSKEDLEADNNKDIYYDTQFDPTRYDTMDVYKIQLDSLSSDKDKEAFLIQILQQEIGMTVEQSKIEATALFLRKRIVPEGVFALLTVDNTYTYYKRIDNVWVEDTSIPKIPLESNTIFCNIQPKCLLLKSECETINQIKIPSYIDKLKTFDSEVEKAIELFKQQVDNAIIYHMYYYKQVVYIEGIKKLKNNNMYYSLGIDSGVNKPIVSPYLDLMTAIIGQSDFVKRQHDIMKFINLYTRTAELEENKFFRYCIKTSVPLMPTFLIELASTWITTNNKYIQKLDSICFKQGKLSDDGDSWVDEHSGYIIKMIETVSEQQTIGSELVLSNELFIAPKKKIELNKNLDTIINAIANKLGINVEKQILDIKTIYNDLIANHTFLKTSTQFQAQLKKKDKYSDKAYNKYKNIMMVRAAIATIISVLQTAIPNYHSITNNPGCVKDFSGYPLSNKENTAFIHYIICIVKLLINSYEPWKYIRSHRDKLEQFAIKDISKIVENKKYQLLKRKKIAYLELNPIDEKHVPTATIWAQFLPPLTSIDQNSVEPCDTKLLSDLKSDIHIGNKDQYNKINILKGKIQLFSVSVLKTISKAIKKEAALLSNSFNEPFVENACCLEQYNTGIITYLFGSPPKQLTNFFNNINSYDAMLLDIYHLSKAPVILSLVNTTIIFSNKIPDYSENIIILAIINYCNYDNFQPVPENLIPICGDKPDNYDSLDTFEKKATIIKETINQINDHLLFSMLKVVYKRTEDMYSREKILYGHSNILVNYVSTFSNVHSIPPIEELIIIYLESNIELLEEYNNAKEEKNIAKQMKIEEDAMQQYKEQIDEIDNQVIITNRYFFNILDTINNDTYSKSVLELIDEFDKFNSMSRDAIKDIISFSDISSSLKKLFIQKKSGTKRPFIDELLNWKDNNISNLISWLQYIVYYMTTILPNIIINDYKYENIQIPKYWKLHPNHELKIKKLVSSEVAGSEFNPFIQFMYKDNLKVWFKKIESSLDYYWNISKSIIIREKEECMFDETTSKIILEYCILEICKLYIGEEEDADDDADDRILFIATAMKMFLRTKEDVDWSFDEIIYDVNKSKETEKEAVIYRLEGMSDEEKQLDKEMKNLKLGPWAIEHVTSYNAAEWAKTDTDAEIAAIVEDVAEHDNIDDYLGENADE